MHVAGGGILKLYRKRITKALIGLHRGAGWSAPFIVHVQHSQVFLQQCPYVIMVYRPVVKSAYQKIIFLFLNQNICFWVLKRTVSMRRFF